LVTPILFSIKLLRENGEGKKDVRVFVGLMNLT
jgi:hypothetical protein